jgi:hypothetical protein
MPHTPAAAFIQRSGAYQGFVEPHSLPTTTPHSLRGHTSPAITPLESDYRLCHSTREQYSITHIFRRAATQQYHLL